ncbi:translation initiation factor IF-2 subunit gamma [Candidatus Pacearchaeota archaeon CG_4_9_14_0_2_um_filter_39_13]|nr:translation initiation factor IF-2 subunit gamma [Candidatus Pacearchaeota archaeon]OIO42586.1 MAG: translation initiation factor IF-2 subunit gamma [Candidatus Pacearchaeota archaeon CG1_02_39_14]PJC44324.1 MAG: translation initiation factor IF-2 subunit gamma [Candidatus Pacearchaeota archaeon CG_4_9_14_0_2_um_filter_39_13]
MDKENIENLPTLNIALVGHIDHGKTTLLQKLSGKWTDTHSEELKRGITIKLGYADAILYNDKDNYNIEGKGKAERYISFVDAPGHEMLMATMLSGAAIVDAAILVIAANEGIKPQTQEHLIALQAKGIKNIIIAQNKIDLVSKEKALENYRKIKEFVKGTIAQDSPIIPVSAQQLINLQEIFKAIAEIKVPARDSTGEAVFVVARSFDINRPGTTPEKLHGAVLGGALRKGTLKIGDEIEIKPGLTTKEQNQMHYKTLKTKIVNLFKGTHELKSITPGGSISIETELDMALGKTDILSGCVVSESGKLPEIETSLKLKYSLFEELFGMGGHQKIDPLKVSEMVMLSVNTSTTVGIIKKISGNEIQLSLKIPVVPFRGDNVGIARNVNNHWRLIGYGEIL